MAHTSRQTFLALCTLFLATGAATVAVGCPFCMTMITDGTKAKGVEEKVKVKDVAELIAARLPAPSGGQT